MKDCDVIVLEQEKKVNKISKVIKTTYIVVTLCLSTVYFTMYYWMNYSQVCNWAAALDWIHSILLLYTVLLMRKAITNQGFAKTNDVLVMMHAVNFIGWCLLETVETILFNSTYSDD